MVYIQFFTEESEFLEKLYNPGIGGEFVFHLFVTGKNLEEGNDHFKIPEDFQIVKLPIIEDVYVRYLFLMFGTIANRHAGVIIDPIFQNKAETEDFINLISSDIKNTNDEYILHFLNHFFWKINQIKLYHLLKEMEAINYEMTMLHKFEASKVDRFVSTYRFVQSVCKTQEIIMPLPYTNFLDKSKIGPFIDMPEDDSRRTIYENFCQTNTIRQTELLIIEENLNHYNIWFDNSRILAFDGNSSITNNR
ncbi:hypothetical protein TBLA_0H02630 [Henningerozyma blattae CBS 6284]|uniref:Uncharacterized protein n=1 Tax=Henningerozyma blattae (strain ATCC 34711 / CBS 6284 / DSM 70876 / NBRC 10599 / NRRL Y-10934 / UCD 77-7) TaxID=1071380 RepID=I2H845_HENB6|nr:hypothetical protein TBLA_0H02630 [Tetrapisispora blattae CBS 6284]CCH62547.1 hypothetical protein TBLA_0H02630 [Tetrapisispora blattae CBS 6284]